MFVRTALESMASCRQVRCGRGPSARPAAMAVSGDELGDLQLPSSVLSAAEVVCMRPRGWRPQGEAFRALPAALMEQRRQGVDAASENVRDEHREESLHG